VASFHNSPTQFLRVLLGVARSRGFWLEPDS